MAVSSETLPVGSQAVAMVGCPDCDLLVRVRQPNVGETARCPRCGYALTQGIEGGFARALAYAVTALILMIIALAFPFIAVNASGLTNTVTLGSTVTSLLGDFDAVAVMLIALVLLIPGAMMAGAAMLTALLLAGRPSRLLAPLAKALFHLNVWYMADVFSIGVIVSLVKLSTMADVLLGVAFWAYLGFAAAFLMTITSLDRLAVWTTIEELRGA